MTVRRGTFVHGTDLGGKQRLFDLFAKLEQSSGGNALLLFNAVDAFAVSEYRDYIESLKQSSAVWKKIGTRRSR